MKTYIHPYSWPRQAASGRVKDFGPGGRDHFETSGRGGFDGSYPNVGWFCFGRLSFKGHRLGCFYAQPLKTTVLLMLNLYLGSFEPT